MSPVPAGPFVVGLFPPPNDILSPTINSKVKNFTSLATLHKLSYSAVEFSTATVSNNGEYSIRRKDTGMENPGRASVWDENYTF